MKGMIIMMKGTPKGKGKGKGKGKVMKPLMKPRPRLVLPKEWTHVSLAKALTKGQPDLDQSRAVRNFLQRKFSWDFNMKNFSEDSRRKLAAIRAGIWWRLFASSTKAQRWSELNQAKVSIEELRNIKHHICPLGFKSREQLAGMMSDLSSAIPRSWGHHKIVFSGSATTFYSENPDKTDPTGEYHWFDKEKKGDYDLSISFDNLSKPRAALKEPKTAEWGSFWGSSAVTSALDLRSFYAKWGFHPYNMYPKTRTVLNRDIGIVILNYPYEESGTFCKFWKKDYVWASSSKAFLTPKYGVLNAETGGLKKPKGGGKGGKTGK